MSAIPEGSGQPVFSTFEGKEFILETVIRNGQKIPWAKLHETEKAAVRFNIEAALQKTVDANPKSLSHHSITVHLSGAPGRQGVTDAIFKSILRSELSPLARSGHAMRAEPETDEEPAALKSPTHAKTAGKTFDFKPKEGLSISITSPSDIEEVYVPSDKPGENKPHRGDLTTQYSKASPRHATEQSQVPAAAAGSTPPATPRAGTLGDRAVTVATGSIGMFPFNAPIAAQTPAGPDVKSIAARHVTVKSEAAEKREVASKQLEDKSRALINMSQLVRKKMVDCFAPDASPAKIQEGCLNLRELNLINLEMKKVLKDRLKEPTLKLVKDALKDERAANAEAGEWVKPRLEKFFLGNDNRVKYLAEHPKMVKDIRSQLSNMQKDPWKWNVIMHSKPEHANKCIALLKQDIIKALTDPERGNLESVTNDVQRMWTVFPAFMAQLKNADPTFAQLSALLNLQTQAEAKAGMTNIQRVAAFAQEHIVPAKAKMDAEEWGHGDWDPEQLPMEYMPDDIEELDIAVTTAKNTFENLVDAANQQFDKAVFKLASSPGRKTLPREKTRLVLNMIEDSNYLISALQKQAEHKGQPIVPKEIQRLQAYQKLAKSLIDACTSKSSVKKGAAGQQVTHIEYFVNGSDLNSFVEGLERLKGQKGH